MNEFLSIHTPEISLSPKILFWLGEWPVSSALATGFLITLIIIFTAIFISLVFIKKRGKPSRVQLAIESIYSYFHKLTTQITGSQKIAEAILPIILSIVIYIGLANTILLLPFIGSLTLDSKSIFSTNTSDLNTTFGIASTVVLWTQWSSIKKFSLLKHIDKYFKVSSVWKGIKKGPGAFAMSLIDVFIGILDIVSEFAKSLSLSLRLFGNMFAGEVLTSLVLSLLAVILPVALMLFSAFSGLLQALVFGALSAAYFGSALKEE